MRLTPKKLHVVGISAQSAWYNVQFYTAQTKGEYFMSQKTRILIYILAAIAAVILGTLALLNNRQEDKPESAQEHIDLGRIYLTELSYEKAVLEFTEAIEIEPLNADAYLGLAESYAGMGDVEKAVEILEEGYDKTGDERLKDMMEELNPTEETTVTTTSETEKTTTAITTKAVTEITSAEVITTSAETTETSEITVTTPETTTIAETTSNITKVTKGKNISNENKYSSQELEDVILKLIENPNADIEQEKLDAIKWVYFLGKDFYSVNRTLDDKYGFSCDGLSWQKDLPENFLVREEKSQVWHEYGDLTNLDFVMKLNNITSLKVKCNKIEDIDALKNKTTLTTLDLSNNNVSDITALKELTGLKNLLLWHNQIENIDVLYNLINLQGLWISSNPVNDDDIQKLKKALPDIRGIH